MQKQFDRAAEDLGNSIHLEHVNVQVPDPHLAQLFYVAGLGLTRDPYMMAADTNMWVNAGRSQFHLPTGKPQVVRGHTGLVIAGRAALLDRLTRVRRSSKAPNSRSANTTITSRRPVRGATRCASMSRTPSASDAFRSAFRMWSSMCRSAARRRSRRSIRRCWDARERPERRRHADARQMGKNQYLQFRETDAPQPEFDGHHVQMYITNFSGPYRKLKERNLISLEDNQYQYRFQDIVDLDSGKALFTVEHEVRSFTHPMCLRPLVNRNPATNNRNYANGYDSSLWAMGPEEYDERDMRPRN